MAWVGFQLPARGMDGEVHVLHGHRPQQDVIAKHQCPDEAEAVLEGHLHWPTQGTRIVRPSAPVTSRSDCCSSFSATAMASGMQSIQARERLDGDRFQIRFTRVAQLDAGVHVAHGVAA